MTEATTSESNESPSGVSRRCREVEDEARGFFTGAVLSYGRSRARSHGGRVIAPLLSRYMQ